MAKKPKALEPIIESLAIAATPETVWAAVTSPRAIGDIVMGHVEMDAKPTRPFHWPWSVWAASAPAKSAPGDAAWRGLVLDVVPGSTLVLSGDGATVTFTIKGERGATLVTLIQASFPPGTAREDFQYGWADFLFKLKTLLEHAPVEDAIFVRALVRAKPAEIIKTWLSPTAMSKIVPAKVKISAKPGGAYEWKRKDGVVTGKFIEIEKNHFVSFTWMGEGLARPGEVRLCAEPTPYGAMVALEMRAADTIRHLEHHRRLWAHLLERLRVYFYYDKKIRVS
jgi:uncharacterized protein YndB with AHSA1/START domain